MAEGLSRHGIESNAYSEGAKVPEETVICWGWRIGRPLREIGKNVLMMERGFIERMKYTSLGWNGLNGRAVRNWTGDGSLRLESLFPRALRRWEPTGRYALVIGQVSGDEAVRGIDLLGFCRMAVAKCYEAGFREVRFRPHPVSTQYGLRDDVGVESCYRPLTESLAGASLVVTFNSNTGVDAVLAGKPTITCDQGSMAWPVAMHDFNALTVTEPPGRVAWASRLAWSQFSIDEIRSGFAWDVVKDSPTTH